MGRRYNPRQQHNAGAHQNGPAGYSPYQGGKPHQQHGPRGNNNPHHHNAKPYREPRSNPKHGGIKSVPPWQRDPYAQAALDAVDNAFATDTRAYKTSHNAHHNHNNKHTPRQYGHPIQTLALDSNGYQEDFPLTLFENPVGEGSKMVTCPWQLLCGKDADDDVIMCTCNGQVPLCFIDAFQNLLSENQLLQKQLVRGRR